MKKIFLFLLTFSFPNRILSVTKISSLLKSPLLRAFLHTHVPRAHKDTLGYHKSLTTRIEKALLSEQEVKSLIDGDIKKLDQSFKIFYALAETKKDELGQESFVQLYNGLQTSYMNSKITIINKRLKQLCPNE